MRDEDIARLPELIRSLLSPNAYPHPVETSVDVIQTHISYVVLAGEFAYKVKKPLHLGFLDYSTLERRRTMCDEEVRLNRRLCPDAYLGTSRIVEIDDGFRIDGPGEAVEYAVKMRRVPADRMMPQLLSRDGISLHDIRRIALLLSDFHARAAVADERMDYGRVPGIRRNWDENFAQVEPFAGTTIDSDRFAALKTYVDGWLSSNADVVDRRAGEARVRDCHGDLRSDSIVLHADGSICVMDCIEFSERLRYSDMASDLAFLAMDLDFRDRRDLSDELVATYLEASADATLPLVFSFYKSYRAFVRGKVESLMTVEEEIPAEQRAAAAGHARRYFDLATAYAVAHRSQILIVMIGLTGSGKSYLANVLATRIEAVPVSSDIVRQSADGGTPMPQEFGAGRYSDEQRHQIYERMRELAAEHLALGRSVILDATHITSREREAAADLARRMNVPMLAVFVRASDELTRERLQARAEIGVTASEGRWEIYLAQRDLFEPPDELRAEALLMVEAEDTTESVVDRVSERVEALSPS